MKILIFGGSGKIGHAVAWDLSKIEKVKKIGIVGRNKGKLEETKKFIGSEKIEIHVGDVMDEKEMARIMKNYDVGIIALPDRRTSYKIVETAILNKFNIVDMLEEYHRRPDPYETEGLEIKEGMSLDEYGDYLHETAIKNNVTFLDGMGFAPGISNIVLGEGIRKLDKAESAIARVGGIPSKKDSFNHPLRYIITWTFRHVLREYMIKTKVIKNGEIIEVEAGTELEKFRFNKFGKDEELECAITPGMPSFVYTRPFLKEFAEKTIRWPGHWEGIKTLKECGLLSLEPVEFEGVRIIPREFFLHIIEPKLRPSEGETDVCVMWCTVKGIKNGKRARIDYYMWDEADTENKISAMERTTGFPTSVGAIFIAEGKIKEKGIVAPEDAIKDDLYNEFIEELKKRNIIILEEIKFEE